jgi:hypothetical protein
MNATYPKFLSSAHVQSLDPDRVPEVLREYIPFAAVWGIADDLERESLVERAPDEAKDDLAALIERIDDDLDQWLAGPEADSPNPSAEYVAFSAMRMAADYI